MMFYTYQAVTCDVVQDNVIVHPVTWCCLQAHEREGYRWWAQRLGRSFQLYDETRVDHFRGFAGQHRINYNWQKSAIQGTK